MQELRIFRPSSHGLRSHFRCLSEGPRLQITQHQPAICFQAVRGELPRLLEIRHGLTNFPGIECCLALLDQSFNFPGLCCRQKSERQNNGGTFEEILHVLPS